VTTTRTDSTSEHPHAPWRNDAVRDLEDEDAANATFLEWNAYHADDPERAEGIDNRNVLDVTGDVERYTS